MANEEVSFSYLIKNEILEYDWTKKQLDILFFSLLRTNGTFKKSNYVFSTTLLHWEKKITKLFETCYGLKIKPIKQKTQLKYVIKDPDFLDNFANDIGNLVIESQDELKAYLAGAFVGKGWISSPSTKFYHFELRVRNLLHSLDIQEAMDSLGIKTTTIQKNGWYYTYVKKSMEISNLISAFNASQSMMMFEDARISRDFISTYKKMESIEGYNYQKSHENSLRQSEAIKVIKGTVLENSLSKNEKDIMELRLEFPNYSLSELKYEYNEKFGNNISKSTINNWLNKICNLSKLKGVDK